MENLTFGENFSFENINQSRKQNILKSFSENLFESQSNLNDEISKAIESDVLEKGGKRATLGEIREWSGKKYQKTTQGWIPYAGKGHGSESLKDGDIDVTDSKSEKKDKIITSAMVEKIKEKNPQSDKEIVGAMRMYAQEVKNTYTESEYSEMLDEYKEITGKEYKKEDSKQKEDKKEEAKKDNKKGNRETDKLIDALKVSDNDYKDLSKVTVEATPKGNWRVYYDNKSTGVTYNGSLLSEETIRDFNLEHYSEND